MAGVLLGVMMLFTASTTAFAYVEELQRQIGINAEQAREYFASEEYEHWKN